ncbi:MAG: SurA N-terminal domain-containing protein [Hyphomicrobiales bacterium]
MLDVFRNAAKGWTAKILIGLLAASFGVWGIADVFTGYRAGALVTVGSEEVSAEEFTRAFNQALQNLASQSGQTFSAEEARRLGIDRSVLGNLIQSAALDAQGGSLELAVSDAGIAQEAMDNPAFKGSGGKFDPALFRRVLEQNGLNEAMYLASERRSKLRQALAETADGGLAAPRVLAEALHRYRNEERDVRYFIVKAAETEIAPPTDDEIKKHYEADPKSYTAPEYRRVAMMKAEPADIAAKLSLAEEELKAGYEKFKGDYFTPELRTVLQMSFPTLDEARKTKERLAAGADFLAIAKERGLTEADATLANKTKADFFDPKVAEQAFSLAEGAVSEPIEGNLAITLIKIVKATPEHQESFDDVKQKLGERLQFDRAREEVQSVYDAVEDARAAQTPFETIAERAGIPFQLAAAVDAAGRDKDGKDADIPHKAEVLKAAFESDVGVESDALSIGDGFIWYEVREVIPSALRPLDTVKDKVKADVIATKLKALALDKAKKLVERAASAVAFETLAQEASAEIKTAQGLKRNEAAADFDGPAVAAAFSVKENAITFALEGDGKGAKLIQPVAVRLTPFVAGSEAASKLADETKDGMAKDVLALYLGALQQELSVSINENLWRQIAGTQTP